MNTEQISILAFLSSKGDHGLHGVSWFDFHGEPGALDGSWVHQFAGGHLWGDDGGW